MKRASLACLIAITIGLTAFAPEPALSQEVEASEASLRGRVLSITMEAVNGVEIRLDPETGVIAVNENGFFEIRGLGAGVYVLIASAEGYAEQSEVITIREGERIEHDILLSPAYRALGEITVNSSFSLNRTDPSAGVALDRQQLLELPHIGDDVIRALPLLPGVAAGDTSGQFNVRGGLFREVLFSLDGLEIYEPYHLKDFDGVFTIIDPRLLDEVQLLPGGFTAEFGDRSAAVIDLTTVEPEGPTTKELGISFMTMWANGQGGFAEDRGSWFGSVRRGFLDLIMDLVGPDDSETEREEGDGPSYWDVNGKVGYDITPDNRITGRLLWSKDTVDREEWEIEDGYPEYEFWDTSYGNASLWVHDAWVLGERSFLTTIASYNRVDQDRRAAGEDYVGTTSIRDERDMTVLGLRQDWSYQASPAHYLKWGFDVRRYDAEYDYENEFSNLGQEPGMRRFADDFQSDNYSVYLADRFRLGQQVTAEIGARWDSHELTDEDHFSPRVNLAWSPTSATVLRLGWGHYFQSQRPHELQVQDGETEFLGAERAEHRVLGFEHWWGSGEGHWSLRAEAYQRLMTDVRPRYENLFDPFQLYPETSYDRYRIAPESAEAVGAELFLARRGAGKLDWWVNYTWSEVTDRIDGRDVPRQFDQTHAFTLSATWRPNPKWTLSGAWLYHTGWPTTKVSGRLEPGPDGEDEIVPVLGPINDERLPDYHRLDVRVSRRYELKKRGSLEVFLDVQNLYSRRNVSGYVVDDRAFSIGDDGEVVYTPDKEKWLGIMPSFGISWRF